MYAMHGKFWPAFVQCELLYNDYKENWWIRKILTRMRLFCLNLIQIPECYWKRSIKKSASFPAPKYVSFNKKNSKGVR